MHFISNMVMMVKLSCSGLYFSTFLLKSLFLENFTYMKHYHVFYNVTFNNFSTFEIGFIIVA
jgi:hypothetical protein